MAEVLRVEGLSAGYGEAIVLSDIAFTLERRQAMALLGPTHGTGIWDKNDENGTNDTVLKKLFREIGPRYASRPGGYTRIMKQHYRRLGDASVTAVIELLKAGETKVQSKKAKPVAVSAPLAPTPTPIAPTPAAQPETPATT